MTMQIKPTNNVLNSFVEQESQLQAQTRPTTSQGIAAAKDAFEKPNLAASNPGVRNILDSMFEVPDSEKDILENALPPKETKLKPPPPEEKEPERTSNSNLDFKPARS